MSKESVMPRPRIIFSVLGPAVLFGLLAWVMQIAFVHDFTIESLAAAQDWGGVAIVIGSTVAYIVARKSWKDLRSNLRESEHYVFLVGAALYVSVLFGVADYAMFRQGSGAFVFNESSQHRILEGIARPLSVDRVLFLNIAKTLKTVVGEVLTDDGLNYIVRKDLKVETGMLEIKCQAATVILKTYPGYGAFPGGYVPPRATVSLVWEGGTLSLPRPIVSEVEAKIFAILNKEGSRPKEEVSSILMSLTESVQTQGLNPMEAQLDKIRSGHVYPLSVFILSKMLDMLGSSISYYSPISVAAQLLTLVFATAKFLLLGWFVTLLARHLAKVDEGIRQDSSNG